MKRKFNKVTKFSKYYVHGCTQTINIFRSVNFLLFQGLARNTKHKLDTLPDTFCMVYGEIFALTAKRKFPPQKKILN